MLRGILAASVAVFVALLVPLPLAGATAQGLDLALSESATALKQKPKKADGRLKVTISGLQGHAGRVTVRGPQKYKMSLTSSTTLRRLIEGTYRLSAAPFTADQATFYPTLVPRSKIKVKVGRTSKVTAAYTVRPWTSPPTSGPTPNPTPNPSNPVNPPSSTGSPVRFDLTNAAGMAMTNTANQLPAAHVDRSAAPSSNLSAVNPDGSMRQALSSGNISVRQFYIAPDEQIYLFLDSPIDLETSQYKSDGCLLLRVTAGQDKPTCVDSTLRQVGLLKYGTNPQIQFDDSGAIYYGGSTQDGRTVLRRNSNGVITDLITDNVYISEFLVAPDSSVYLTGYTRGTNNGWTRRISPQGALSTLYPDWRDLLKMLSDGNVYFIGNNFTFNRYLVSEGRMDPRPWLHFRQGGPDLNAHYLCESIWQPLGYTGCHLGWERPVGLFNTLDGDSVAAIGKGDSAYGAGHIGFIMRYLPNPGYLTTSVVTPTVALPVINTLLLAGMTDDNRNTLVAFNTSTGTERELIDASQEVEIYHLAFSSNSNAVMFDGLRFSDNQFVIGAVDMGSGRVTMTPSRVKLADFQAL